MNTTPEQRSKSEFKPLTQEDVLNILTPEIRQQIYDNAEKFFESHGDNGIETINIKFAGGPFLMQVVQNPADLKECTIEINVDKINADLSWLLENKKDIPPEDYIISAFAHEVGHAYGYLHNSNIDGLLNVQAGVDYRLASSNVKQVKLGKDGILGLYREHILFSGSLINELLTDHFGFNFVKEVKINGRGINYFSGYSTFGSFLYDFVELVSALRDCSSDDIFAEFIFGYAQGEPLDSQTLFYSKLPKDLDESDRAFFYKVLRAGYGEIFDLKFRKEIQEDLQRMIKKH